MLKIDWPPYSLMISVNFLPMVSMASSHVIRTQPGSSPLGFVRFMGW